jgi:hypothetical protein
MNINRKNYKKSMKLILLIIQIFIICNLYHKSNYLFIFIN